MKKKEVTIMMDIMESNEDYMQLKNSHRLSANDIRAVLGDHMMIFEYPWEVCSVEDKDGEFIVTVSTDKISATVQLKTIIDIQNNTGVLNTTQLNNAAKSLVKMYADLAMIYDTRRYRIGSVISSYSDVAFFNYATVTANSSALDKIDLPDVHDLDDLEQCTKQVEITPVMKFSFDNAIKYLDVFNHVIQCDNNKLYTGTLKLGGTIHLFDRDWVICHIEDGKYYLGAAEIEECVSFIDDEDDDIKYAGSNLFRIVYNYELALVRRYPQEVKDHLVDVQVNSVTGKVFVPTVNQMDGGFDYFEDEDNRICNYKGLPDWYWTSSPFGSSTVWRVSDVGGLNNGYPGYTRGFRPFICFKP